jgi:hypothetical protein
MSNRFVDSFRAAAGSGWCSILFLLLLLLLLLMMMMMLLLLLLLLLLESCLQTCMTYTIAECSE